MIRMESRRAPYILAAVIACITLVVFLPALRNGYVLWDDDRVVYDNIRIRSLDLAFFRWAFTDLSLSLWQPAAWISHAIDRALWGPDPFGHHLTSVVLHAFNTLLVVYTVIALLQAYVRAGARTGSRTQLDDTEILIAGGVTGALFGLHPLHVESVAWITGRTDLLCTLFYLLAVLSYLHAATPQESALLAKDAWAFSGFSRYRASLLFGMLALASKPAAVTLPVILLLLDWYPLRRIRSGKELLAAAGEKLPWFLFSICIGMITLWATKATGDLTTFRDASFLDRIGVSSRALAGYLAKAVVPLNLHPYYPYPGHVSLLSAEYASALGLGVIVLIAGVLARRRLPVLTAVILFFLITLLPSIGIVKVRSVYMADRYAYLPLAGPLLLVGLACSRIWAKGETPGTRSFAVRGIMIVAAAVLTVAAIGLTVRQVAVWEDSISLWSSVVDQEPVAVPAAYHNRGLAYKEMGKLDLAEKDLSKAIAADGGSANSYNTRALVYHDMRRFDLALSDFGKAISVDPAYANAYIGRGWTYRETGRPDLALADLDKAIELDPGRPIAFNNRGMVHQDAGRLDDALADYSRAIELNPYFAPAYTNRGLVYEQSGRPDLAVSDYSSAITAEPSFAGAYNNRGLVYERTGRLEQALKDLNTAIRLDPGSVEAHNNRALVYEDLGRFDEAVADYDRALAVRPDDYLSYANRGIVLRKMGRPENAVEDLTKALALNPGFARAYADRGDCYRDMGKSVLAMRDYRRSCALGNERACASARGYGDR